MAGVHVPMNYGVGIIINVICNSSLLYATCLQRMEHSVKRLKLNYN